LFAPIKDQRLINEWIALHKINKLWWHKGCNVCFGGAALERFKNWGREDDVPEIALGNDYNPLRH
jgi:hypothetical protein